MARVLTSLCAVVAAAQSLPQDGLYVLRNVNSGHYLSVERGSEESGANVVVWHTPDASLCQWQLRSDETGVFTMQNAKSGMYLSKPVEGGLGNGVNVFVESNATVLESHWLLHPVPNGDGTAYIVENVRVGRSLSVSGAAMASGVNVHLWSSPGKLETQWELIGSGSCRDARPGEMCYHDVMWAKTSGLSQHPEWYPGLTTESSLTDIQAHLHFCFHSQCPLPCQNTSLSKCGVAGRVWSNETCEDAVEGSRCDGEITWAMTHGVYHYPQWFPTLTEFSSRREFQARLFQGQQVGELHGCLEPCCHDTIPGEACHEDVAWAMMYGINLPEYNQVYPRPLSNKSHFAEFQAYLHLCFPVKCPVPCYSTEVMAVQPHFNFDCPESTHFL